MESKYRVATILAMESHRLAQIYDKSPIQKFWLSVAESANELSEDNYGEDPGLPGSVWLSIRDEDAMSPSIRAMFAEAWAREISDFGVSVTEIYDLLRQNFEEGIK